MIGTRQFLKKILQLERVNIVTLRFSFDSLELYLIVNATQTAAKLEIVHIVIS